MGNPFKKESKFVPETINIDSKKLEELYNLGQQMIDSGAELIAKGLEFKKFVEEVSRDVFHD